MFEVNANVDFIAGEKECYEDIRVSTIGGGGDQARFAVMVQGVVGVVMSIKPI